MRRLDLVVVAAIAMMAASSHHTMFFVICASQGKGRSAPPSRPAVAPAIRPSTMLRVGRTPISFVACGLALGFCLSRLSQQHRRWQPSTSQRHAAGETEAASDLNLKKAATALRQEVAALEAEKEADRRNAASALYHHLRIGGARSLGPEQLRLALQELDVDDVTTQEAALVLQKLRDRRGDCWELDLEAFQQPTFLPAAKQIIYTHRAEVLAAAQKERAKAAAREELEREEAKRKELLASLPPPNKNTSWGVRVCAILPYMLPLTDTFRFFGYAMIIAVAPGQDVSLLSSLVLLLPDILVPVAGNWDLIEPFLVWGMPLLAVRRGLPLLLRFNLNQAFALQLIFWVGRALATQAAWFVAQSTRVDELVAPLEPGLMPGAEIMVLLMAICLAYSVTQTARGIVPNAIPAVSTEATRSLGSLGPDRSRV